MQPSWRKPAGALAILLFIAVYGGLIAWLAEGVLQWPFIGQLVFFTFAGLIWILPVRPLLRWMETGKFR